MERARPITSEWWKPKELADRWRCSWDSIIRRIKSGEIRAMKTGGTYLIHESEISRHEQAAMPPKVVERGVPKPIKVSGAFAVFQRKAAEKFRRQEKEGLHA